MLKVLVFAANLVNESHSHFCLLPHWPINPRESDKLYCYILYDIIILYIYMFPQYPRWVRVKTDDTNLFGG